MTTSIQIAGIESVIASFRGIQNRLKNPNTVLEVLAGKGYRDIIDHFSKEVSEGDSRWKPLKSRKGRPLQDTGRLRASTRWRVAGANTIHLYTTVEYAKYHYQIDSSGGKIPRRNPFWISLKARLSMIKTATNFYVRGLLS